MTEALLLIAVTAVIASSLAAGFRTRARLAAGLAGAAYSGPDGSPRPGWQVAGRPGCPGAGLPACCCARPLA